MTSTTTTPDAGPVRKDLADRHLRLLVMVAVAVTAAGLLLKAFLPAAFQRPGTPLMQSSAILGAFLLLAPFAYVIAKRTGIARSPNRGLIAHIGASLAGLVLVVLHSGGELFSPPSTMLYALAGLVISGAYARLRVARDMASTLGGKLAAFAPPDPALQQELRRLIGEKSELLAKLDPQAREATFSVNLRHCLKSPRLAWRYAKLARREAGLIGARSSVGSVQAWWRPLHLALAVVFLAALIVHVIAVTFFAGYVAQGRPITWWHVTAW